MVGNGKLRILLADDNVELREMFRDFLHLLGYQVTTASDGHQALKIYRAEDHNFDLLISDIIMPRIGGIELVETIRSKNKQLPVILMSGFSDIDMESSCSHLNASFIAKPINFEALEQMLQNIDTVYCNQIYRINS
ncbi:response regulator [Mariprofundus sp. KV]|nr:response regulator [Mariprofundus sp. KV]